MANPYHPYQSEENMMKALYPHSNDNNEKNVANYIAEYAKINTHAERVAKLFKNRNTLSEKKMMGVLKAYPYVYDVVEKEIEEKSKNTALKFKEIDNEIDAYLEESNLERIQTNGDGNCFFYAIQGYGDIKRIPRLSISVSKMRDAVAQTIQTKKDLYLPSFVSIAELQAHVRDIRKCEERGTTNIWADEVDVAAFSDHFNVCIVIHDWRKTNHPPYHIAQISYPNNCDVGRHTNPIRIHILRTNMNHYSLLMPIDDPEYNALKNLVESVYLPLDINVIKAHQQQLEQMASSSPRPLPGYAQAAAINLTHVGLNPAPASVSGSWKCHVCTFDNRAGATTCEMCGASKNTSRLPGASAASAIPLNGLRGKSAAPDIPRNGTNMPAQAASSSSVVQQLVSNASRTLSGVHLNQPSELHQQIAKLQQQIPILKTQIAKLEKSDPKGELKTKKALLEKQEAQLEKRLDILSKKGGTRKRRTLKKRRTHKKQNKNNRKSKSR
jgi:hypothetical protein